MSRIDRDGKPIVTDKDAITAFYKEKALMNCIGNISRDMKLSKEERQSLLNAVYREGLYSAQSKLVNNPNSGNIGNNTHLKGISYNKRTDTNEVDTTAMYDTTLAGLDFFVDNWERGVYDKSLISKDFAGRIDAAKNNPITWTRSDGGNKKELRPIDLPLPDIIRCMALDVKMRSKRIDGYMKTYEMTEGDTSKTDWIDMSYRRGLSGIKSNMKYGDYVALRDETRRLNKTNLLDSKEETKRMPDGTFVTIGTDYNRFIEDENGNMIHEPNYTEEYKYEPEKQE